MSSILQASAAFDESINNYANLEQESLKTHRRSDFGRSESRAFGALAMLGTLTASVAFAVNNGGDVTNAFLVAPVVAGVVTYVAHQAAPYRQEITDSIKSMASSIPNIGSGISGAFSRFGQAIKSLGDGLGLTDGARAVKADAKYLKSIMRVDSLSSVRSLANTIYGKQDGNYVVNEAKWLRDGIDQAVKDKLAAKDYTSISYSDIQTGILKQLEKNNMLRAGIEDSRGSVDVIENVALLLRNPSRSNFELPKGDFSKIADDYAINKLHHRDASKGIDNFGPK